MRTEYALRGSLDVDVSDGFVVRRAATLVYVAMFIDSVEVCNALMRTETAFKESVEVG